MVDCSLRRVFCISVEELETVTCSSAISKEKSNLVDETEEKISFFSSFKTQLQSRRAEELERAREIREEEERRKKEEAARRLGEIKSRLKRF